MLDRFKIRTRIVISFFVMVSLAVFLIGGFGYITAGDTQRKEALTNFTFISNIKRKVLEEFFERIGGRVIDFSSDGLIREKTETIIFSKRKKDAETAVRILNDHLKKNKMPLDAEISGIVILDQDGNVIASSDEREMGKSESEHDYFINIKNSAYGVFYIGEIAESHHFGGNRPVIAAAAPVYGIKSAEQLGVIVNYTDIGQLNEKIFTAIDVPGVTHYETMESILVNEEKLLITDSRFVESVIFKQVADTVPVRECSEKKKNYYGNYYDYRGINVFGASECLPNGWTLVTKADEEDVLGGIRRARDKIILISLAVIFFESLIFYFLALGIVNPILKIAAIAKKIASGDLYLRAPVVSKDATGELAQAFNRMAEKLIEANAGLERKIEERTADLQKFQLAVENASDLVVITDKEGVVIYANVAAERITGYGRKEILGKKAGTLWGGQMLSEFYKKMWKRIKTDKKIFTGEIINKRKNGEKYIAAVNIAPILDKRGGVRFFVSIERDITQEKEIDRAKTEFVSIASHQLRTPLTGIKWYLEMLLSGDAGKLSPAQKKYADEAYHSNDRMITLVNALLNASRIDTGTFAVSPKKMKIEDVIDLSLKELGGQIKEKKLSVAKRTGKNLPVLNADPNLLKIVIQNILSNAVKYTPDGGKIIISAMKNSHYIILSVSDNGYGIPDSAKGKIFTKLFRADNVRTRVTEGTGLGLYVAKSIVDKSGGKIWFESVENKGTIFYVKMPLRGMKKQKGANGLLPI